MTDAEWVRDLLDYAWQEDLPGRERRVPKPEIITEGEIERRSIQYDTQDVIFTKDGGLPVIEPVSLGYSEERVESIIDIEVFTSQGRRRLLGEVGVGEYSGLSGEVKRILDAYRLGVPEDDGIRNPFYDILIPDTFDDEIGDRPAQEWGGTWTVTFITHAETIQQGALNQQS